MSATFNDLNLSPFARVIIDDAQRLATQYSHEFIMPEHFLLSMANIAMEFDDKKKYTTILRHISDDINSFLSNNVPVASSVESPELSSLMKKAIKNTRKIIRIDRNMPIPATAILIAIMNLGESICASTVGRYINERQVAEFLHFMMAIDGKSIAEYNGDNDLDDDEFDGDMLKTDSWRTLITDLSNLKYDLSFKIIGRQDEMDNIARVLCRCDKNNALIVGESGVGKTTIVKGFVSTISNYPEKISTLPIYELSTASLLANAQYQGDIEQRFTLIMKGIIDDGGGIIVIDDIHTLAGSKGDANGSRDLTGMMLPYLDNEDLRFIGISTFEDITRYLDSHNRFLRRFCRIDIEEPSQQEAIDILNGLKRKYEKGHNVRIAAGTTEQAVKLGKRFLSSRALPDSAIDILDEAGAYRELNPNYRYKKQVINPELINNIVTRMGKLTTKIIDDNDNSHLRTLDQNIKLEIFGQDEAIKQVTTAVLTARAGLTDEHKPQACLLFVGPTGVGKTEVARVLAQQLGITLHKFDMSEYSESYSVSKLIGSAPGYIGYEEGGRLTEAVRKNPHCVLLLDEIEKAHEKIYDSLLQVMDYAALTDSRGRKVDFSNTIIIMTSNSGAQFAKQAGVGFGSTVTTGQAMLSEVKKTFKPEFINRLSGIVVFNDMNREMARQILHKKISELNKRLEDRNITITLSDEATDWLLDKGFSTKYGAREIERVISNSLKPLLVNEILFGKLSKKGHAIISIADDKPILNIAH